MSSIASRWRALRTCSRARAYSRAWPRRAKAGAAKSPRSSLISDSTFRDGDIESSVSSMLGSAFGDVWERGQDVEAATVVPELARGPQPQGTLRPGAGDGFQGPFSGLAADRGDARRF